MIPSASKSVAAVSVDYYPVNPEEWVNIGSSFDSKYSKFVSASKLFLNFYYLIYEKLNFELVTVLEFEIFY